MKRLVTAAVVATVTLSGCTSVVGGVPEPADDNGPHQVKADDLDGLFLSPSEIDRAVGDSGMSVQYTATALVDHSRDVSDPPCTSLLFTAEQTTFQGDTIDAVKVRNLLSDNNKSFASQSIILLPTPSDARATFTRAARQWRGCGNRIITDGGSNVPLPWQIGALEQKDNLLAMPRSLTIITQVCQRALRVAANALIDVSVCTPNIDRPAVTIANKIGDKIPL
ncbi:sensor domain-containing protein [Mycobacterium sp. CBMA271]|uniref:sensor domain-containing protein n=1 Tax=unclassified Mycobacteroides TaxID=2618759 RepID=UPI0012DCF041|nr:MULTISPECIES: sensor domain-containing protein [unclassified Mycobacteroides]MUM17076.1 hypothetical protein [Mycobacteroides sp. CBMA 326]MUM23314.1 sensor domain-containing protein [Mycobacteroides sp. CBMA 271]